MPVHAEALTTGRMIPSGTNSPSTEVLSQSLKQILIYLVSFVIASFWNNLHYIGSKGTDWEAK